MIYIFGDSHGFANFKNIKFENINLSKSATTLYRIGRDNLIINFEEKFNKKDSVFIFCYGEIDCRCHIGRQLDINKNIEEICDNLTNLYFNTIQNNIKIFDKIIICSITPPMRIDLYTKKHGEVTHEFPFLHSDKERSNYTIKMNNMIKNKCEKYKYIYLNVYDYYADFEGMIKYNFSDGMCHVEDNSYILNCLNEIMCANG